MMRIICYKIPESPHLPGWMCNLKWWWTNHLIRDNKDQKSSSKSRILSSGRNSAEPFTAWLKAISKIFYIVKYRDTGLGNFWCPWKPFCGHENVERGMSLAGIEEKYILIFLDDLIVNLDPFYFYSCVRRSRSLSPNVTLSVCLLQLLDIILPPICKQIQSAC